MSLRREALNQAIGSLYIEFEAKNFISMTVIPGVEVAYRRCLRSGANMRHNEEQIASKAKRAIKKN
jgi:hypothetical protein